jgi:hypothetical protein
MTGCPWDRVADKPICPDCQERLALGQAEPLIERAERATCSLCGRAGTLRFLTFPLVPTDPVEMDLCGGHFRALLGRQLSPNAFRELRRQLRGAAMLPEQIFLLHEAFYDSEGRALQPAVPVEEGA